MLNGKRCAAIIQARLNSSRFPYKVVNDLYAPNFKDKDYTEYFTTKEAWQKTNVRLPLINSLAKRVLSLQEIDVVVVAVGKDDFEIIRETLHRDPELQKEWAASRLVCYANHSVDDQDVLSRIVSAGENVGADVIMRVTADCPLWCPGIGQETLYTYMEEPTNRVVTTLTGVGSEYSLRILNMDTSAKARLFIPYTQCPDGTDTEVTSLASLQTLNKGFVPMAYREHVFTPYYEGYASWAATKTSYHLPGIASSIKLSVDTNEDLSNVRTFFRVLVKDKNPATPLVKALCPA